MTIIMKNNNNNKNSKVDYKCTCTCFNCFKCYMHSDYISVNLEAKQTRQIEIH